MLIRKNNIAKIVALLTLGLIPLCTRVLLGSVVMGFHEYEAIFFYASDFFVLLFVALIIHKIHKSGAHLSWWYLIFLVLAGVSVFFAPSMTLSLFSFVRILILGSFAWLLAGLIKEKKIITLCALVLVLSATVQAGIGFAQFAKQGSVGLARFGEPVLLAYKGPSSTIRAEGGRFLRAYGTFPHPNVLAGFLSLGLISIGYLYLLCEERIKERIGKQWARKNWTKEEVFAAGRKYFSSKFFVYRMILAACFFVTSLGLAVTFSRSGWVMAGISLAVLVALSLRHSFGSALRFFLLAAVCFAGVYLMLSPVISPRAELRATEPAVTERLAYGRIGLEVIKNNPLGVGVGNQVLYGVRSGLYKNLGMTSLWQWEPVHNLYLLIASEAGWLGFIGFALFVLGIGWRLLKTKTRGSDFVLALLIGVLVVGLFDHYLWTLQPGRLMLWVVVGMAISQVASRYKGDKTVT
jgi:O-antigen ligase